MADEMLSEILSDQCSEQCSEQYNNHDSDHGNEQCSEHQNELKVMIMNVCIVAQNFFYKKYNCASRRSGEDVQIERKRSSFSRFLPI